MDFRNELNDKQYEAVTTSEQYVRIVAGAGSGKTRVLTYRIAYLISELHVKPWKILAITFTNKVANEMKNRVLNMIPFESKDLTIKTFHSFCAMFLRREISVLGFPQNFTILDEEDQTKIVKDIAEEMGHKRNDPIVAKALSYIAKNKLNEKYPEDLVIKNYSFEDEKECLEIYTRYEEEKNKMLSLDFDDLLLKTNYILEHYLDVRFRWQEKIDHILIDEFQDTNNTEYKLIQYLSKPYTSLYVVGDPDQTIYTWRGANQKIILEIDKQYRGLETIILNQNYRSTQTILDSANKLISHNKLRVAKDLFTVRDKGEKIIVKSCSSSRDEADFVAREIIRLKQLFNYNYKDIVLLYRSNYVTLDFENALTAKGIPYVIYGGQKFYQRREIKDVLSYFRLIVNTKDDVAFERIANVPKRSVGDNAFNIIKKESALAGKSEYEYLRDVEKDNTELTPRVLNNLKAMITAVDYTREEIAKNEETFSRVLERLIDQIGYYEYLRLDDDGNERCDNVKALFEDLRHYLRNNPEATFDEYLQNITLLSAQDEMVDGDYVNLMTVHIAKGLEFPIVFLVRFNSGVFPNQRALEEGAYLALEEERRLAYVGMTRAKERLYFTLANDFSYVTKASLKPSPFLKESGNEVLNVDTEYNPYRSSNPRKQTSFHFDDGPNAGFERDEPRVQNFNQATNDIDDWKVGDIVIHNKFGRGVVLELEGDDIIRVRFDMFGEKEILSTIPAIKKGGYDA